MLNTLELTCNDFIKNEKRPILVSNNIQFPILQEDVVANKISAYLVCSLLICILVVKALFKSVYIYFYSILT